MPPNRSVKYCFESLWAKELINPYSWLSKDIEENTKEVIKAAVALAKSSKEIEVAELSVDIYADSTEEVRNVLPNQSLKHSNRAKAINV